MNPENFNKVKRKHSPTFLRASQPTRKQLSNHAPLFAWDSVAKAAQRSTLNRYHVGAVILDPKKKATIELGWAHMTENTMDRYFGCHAERHMLTRAKHLDLEGCHALVWSANKNFTGLSWSSCPCENCMEGLAKAGIASVTFPLRTGEGWEIITIDPAVSLEEDCELDHIYGKSYELLKQHQ